ncbi:hypothetical protein TNCT_445971, partial [Trichonephila clavata]
SRSYYVPKRVIFVILGFFGIFNVYALRVNLSVAMVAMVNNTEAESRNTSYAEDSCPDLRNEGNEITVSKQTKGEQFNWDAKTQGMVMSSFFYAYFVTVLTGGYLAKKFGAKRIFGAGVLLTSVLTLLTPVAVRWGIVPFIIVRALEGVGEGLSYPVMNTMVGRWAPKLERSRISAAIFSGSPIGTVVSLSLSGWLCGLDFLGGWPAAFYVFGIIGCIWWVFWIIFISETPEEHPSISEEEISLYYQTEDDKMAHMSVDVPWKKIFTSVPMLGLLFGHIGSYFGLSVLMTEIPGYLNSVLHFSVEASGLITGLPNILEAVGGTSSSFIADKLISSGKLKVTTVRKIFNSIALYGSGVCMLGITASGCNPALIITLYSILLYVNGFKYSGFNVTHVDMSPPLAGILFGLTNSIASLSGVVAPNMAGAFTQSGNTRENWNKVFYVTAGVYFVTATVYDLFASAELQKWNTNKISEKNHNIVELKS